jgi:hypothetical protein
MDEVPRASRRCRSQIDPERPVDRREKHSDGPSREAICMKLKEPSEAENHVATSLSSDEMIVVNLESLKGLNIPNEMWAKTV